MSQSRSRRAIRCSLWNRVVPVGLTVKSSRGARISLAHRDYSSETEGVAAEEAAARDALTVEEILNRGPRMIDSRTSRIPRHKFTPEGPAAPFYDRRKKFSRIDAYKSRESRVCSRRYATSRMMYRVSNLLHASRGAYPLDTEVVLSKFVESVHY